MTASFKIGQTDVIASDFYTDGLCKLYHYGICGHLLTWLVKWLIGIGTGGLGGLHPPPIFSMY